MLEGKILGERYEVKRLIGGGGMANVYLGFDNILRREVALKVLKIEYANDEEFITRFHREAHNATSLSHPNIVSIYDVDDEGDIYYMVMEYVEGMTLKKYIQRYGPVPTTDAIFIMEQIADAIANAHENHIIHRDIKPQNILINQEKQVKVTDFGIALALSATSMTQTNAVLGSVHYLSPEQARGGSATAKSDIYSLGIVLFEMLTGRLPFSGQSAVSVALKHLQNDMPNVRDWSKNVPQSLENVVKKATAKDPIKRHDSVDEFYQDLTTSLEPKRINEAPLVFPIEAGDETITMPAFMNGQAFADESHGETIIHSKGMSDMKTKQVPTQNGEHSDVESPNTAGASKKPKKMSKKKKAFIWVISSLTILLMALLFALFVLPNLLQPDEIEVIDFSGQHIDDVEEWLDENNLEMEVDYRFDDGVEVDHVISQEPPAGRMVIEGSTISLLVSTGEEPVEFGDYLGQSFTQVERLLINDGYPGVQRTDVYSDEPAGTIITQVEPSPGEEVIISATTPIFEVSAGRRVITLDDLSGMDEFDARSYLTDKGLIANTTERHSDDFDEGDVISQSPSPGTEVEEGSVVNLVISLGEEELPPITHTVTVDVPYTMGDIETTDPDEFDEEDDDIIPQAPIPQEVRIYIGDMNNDLEDLYESERILEDTTVSIRLNIPPGGTATYRVERDDIVIVQRTVIYEEVAGD